MGRVRDEGKGLTISAGTLGTLVRRDFCSRCFWTELRSKELPFRMPLPGVFSSIDSYVKNVVRSYFDANGRLPTWFPDVGAVAGYQERMHWSSFQATSERSGATLRGVPDEVFHLEGGSYHVIDYKTSRLSSAQGAMYPSYEVQLNAYAYICARVGLAPVEALTLLYLDPDTDVASSPHWLERSRDDFMLGFTPKLRTVEIRPDSFVEGLLVRAASIDRMPTPPPPTSGCKNCSLVAGLFDLVT